jgi:hypothetical protein
MIKTFIKLKNKLNLKNYNEINRQYVIKKINETI